MILRAVKKSIQKEEVNAKAAELPPFVEKWGGWDFIREWHNLGHIPKFFIRSPVSGTMPCEAKSS